METNLKYCLMCRCGLHNDEKAEHTFWPKSEEEDKLKIIFILANIFEFPLERVSGLSDDVLSRVFLCGECKGKIIALQTLHSTISDLAQRFRKEKVSMIDLWKGQSKAIGSGKNEEVPVGLSDALNQLWKLFQEREFSDASDPYLVITKPEDLYNTILSKNVDKRDCRESLMETEAGENLKDSNKMEYSDNLSGSEQSECKPGPDNGNLDHSSKNQSDLCESDITLSEKNVSDNESVFPVADEASKQNESESPETILQIEVENGSSINIDTSKESAITDMHACKAGQSCDSDNGLHSESEPMAETQNDVEMVSVLENECILNKSSAHLENLLNLDNTDDQTKENKADDHQNILELQCSENIFTSASNTEQPFISQELQTEMGSCTSRAPSEYAESTLEDGEIVDSDEQKSVKSEPISRSSRSSGKSNDNILVPIQLQINVEKKVEQENIAIEVKPDVRFLTLDTTSPSRGAERSRQRPDFKGPERQVRLVKQLKCGNCDKAFDTIPDLENHARVGCRPKKHLCIPCNREFGSSSALKQHKNAIHKILPPVNKNRQNARPRPRPVEGGGGGIHARLGTPNPVRSRRCKRTRRGGNRGCNSPGASKGIYRNDHLME